MSEKAPQATFSNRLVEAERTVSEFTLAEFTLIIGDKNYSSWSLRAWLVMKHLGLPFRELSLRLDTPSFKDEILQHGPSGRVPVLEHGELVVWDSLAIVEYLAEVTGRGWPADRAARAYARSVCCEMHSGFANLRTEWPFNARARNRRTPHTPALDADIERIDEIWMECRRRFGTPHGGPWLFGDYSIADAMYAPVVLRFNTYGAQVSDTSRGYMATTLEHPAVREWVRDAQGENWVNEHSEIG